MMKTPDFFNDVPPLVMYDPLSSLLGAADSGILTYTYTDVVKLAGHSCPTVAGAYLMVQKGLKELYGNETPVRGEIKVLMNGKLGDGVVGVIANVASMITGATDIGGFHGLGGKFDRRQLLFYGVEMEGEMALERIDTGARVILRYDPSCAFPDPRMKEILPLVVTGRGDENSAILFATLWQDRVKRILIDHKDNPQLVKCVLQ
ncbi:MAG: hypothetical protein NTY39_08185 [Campylobacterales bacterium]|nr:hypothetical protein [Campylobacterales bacterium]